MNRDQLREAVLGTAAWKKAGILNESAAPVEQQVIEEAKAEETAPEAHTCPLCESTLEGEISDEALLEHAEQMMGVFEEAEQLLAEAEEAEESDEEEIDLLEGIDDEDLEEVAALIEAYGKKRKEERMKAKKG
jgi:DNA repair exonuclease SbcCD ATPase subunit